VLSAWFHLFAVRCALRASGDDAFDADVEEVLARAQAAGVRDTTPVHSVRS
jgi:hypothetical protein